MYPINTKNSGESIVEVMVTMAVASILVLAAIQLVGSSYEVVGETNKRIEAMNLAQEGVEIVRNTRDTNWLKYSGQRRKNWLKIDENEFLDNSDDTQFVEVNIDGSLTLLTDSNIENAYEFLNNKSQETDFTNLLNSSFRLYRNTEGILTSNEISTNRNQTTPSNYYRAVKLNIKCANEKEVTDNDCEKKRLAITSDVFWLDKNNKNFKKTTVKADLYDFYELD